MILLTSVSLVGIAIEKQNLALKRQISLQHYDIESLKERRCQLVLETQQLAAPTRLLQERKQQTFAAESHQTSDKQHVRLPQASGER